MLTEAKREEYFEYLGFGKYNKSNLLKFQKKAFPNNESQHDSKYGKNSDNALRTFYNVKRYTKNFQPQEFSCKCGKCSGYPSYMKKVELEHLQSIRDHFGKPMTITSGLRCTHENTRVGGSANSGHLKGYAADFYISGITDSVESRTKALDFITCLPYHHFSYGANMVDSDGNYRQAASMGNAMHTETHAPMDIHEKVCAKAKQIADSKKYIYVHFDKKYGKECAICHPHGGKNKGWQCIGYAIACWHHGGIPCKCNCQVFTNQIYEKMLYDVKIKEALKIARQRLGVKSIKIIRNKKGIDPKKIQKGDLVIFFKGKKYVHTTLGVGAKKIADCTSSRTPNIKYGVKSYTKWTPKLIIRYTGK